MSKLYTITWKIEVDAESSTEAALIARNIQKDPKSTATYFEVQEWAATSQNTNKIHNIDLSYQ